MSVSKRELMIVAGEASGDELGAELVRGVKKIAPDIRIFGTCGPKMRNEGVESIADSDKWSVVGIAAVAGAVPKFLRIKKELRKIASERKPRVVILVDFPEFNLKLAKNLKADGHRVIYYVSPQAWAWRQYRYRTIRDSVDLLLSILPFEKSWYRTKGVEHVEIVRNPIALRAQDLLSRSDFCEKYRLDSNNEIIAILPGSRKAEIRRHLETMLEAAVVVKHARPKSQFIVAAGDKSHSKLCESIVDQFDFDREEKLKPSIVCGDTLNVLNAADAAGISSGTATLEAGVIGTPMVVVYRIPKLDAIVFKPFVDVPHFALINLVAQKRVVAELIQNDFTSEKLSGELLRLLEAVANRAMRKELLDATREIRDERKKNAAEIIIEFLNRKSSNDPKS